MSKSEGIKQKYTVSRVDGKPVGPCIVLEFRDPLSWTALLEWASTAEKSGYMQLAKEVRENVNYCKEQGQ